MSEFVRCPHYQHMQGVPQSTISRCWLAGYTMLFGWGGMARKDVEPYVLRVLGEAGIDVNEALHSGLHLKDNKKAAQALGLGCSGYGQPVTEHDLKQHVRRSPVWATGRWFESSNHVIVITGVSDTKVECFDPWYETGPWEALEMQTKPLDWVLHGRGNTKGLAHTFQWYPLHYFKV